MQDKNVQEILNSNAHIISTTVCSKMVKVVAFMLCVFHHNLKKKGHVKRTWNHLDGAPSANSGIISATI